MPMVWLFCHIALAVTQVLRGTAAVRSLGQEVCGRRLKSNLPRIPPCDLLDEIYQPGGQFWAIEMEVSLSNTDSSEVPQEGRPMVEAEAAKPEIVSSESN
ncbi:hypothetical protein FOZ62_001662 [Perkinsus olseni]|uniref:Secreted protein n=1 Tax=Perkinsus olseni TaxID=32597 RepID=A0A7J6S2X5_PEROL|nr:hypothetical protein FOZ62_001662 [Perkinsus olseni]